MGEIVFFDVETTVPLGGGKRFWMLEFGAILVCPKKLVEVDSYCTLIRPGDLSAVEPRRFSGITRDAVSIAPLFEEVADRIFDILNGRVWAGHNIQRFDCARIREAFADIGKPPPEPLGLIDSLSLLTQAFGNRAGNLKMATLASYFGLGQQKHRSLDDVRMNLEVLKHCATVLLLESSLPQTLRNQCNMVTRSRANYGKPCGEEASRKSPPTSISTQRVVPYKRERFGKVMDGAKVALASAQTSRPLHSLLRHSRSLLR
ncbi:protein NEN4 [Dioscorea cayenensis subsp. rotundata]|uniref:Protein NEN4 n=1 Tax=Dioscorea cayennensis subsp. rotundata TaxID=55577 RepID=A0AB40BSJ3_DIOCR|nr:protein NEN4 [Dioscorea cayenensis subsp. rotundata]